jgi:hypothetical protein
MEIIKPTIRKPSPGIRKPVVSSDEKKKQSTIEIKKRLPKYNN